MKRTYADSRGTDEPKATLRYVVSQAAVCSLVAFYDATEMAVSAHESRASRVFDEYNFFCGVGDAAAQRKRFNSGDGIKRPEVFNTESFLERTRRVLSRAMEYNIMIGGVAIWAVKDMAKWYWYYVNARTADERNRLSMPYGVLEADEYTLECHQGPGREVKYVVVPTPEALAASGHRLGWKCTFVDFSMHLRPVDESRLSLFEKRAGVYLPRSYHAHALERMRIPRSPFYSLADESEQLEAVRTNLFDADWLAAHPRPVVRIVVPPPVPLANIPESELYKAPGGIINASINMRKQFADMDTQQTVNMITSVQQSINGAPMPKAKTLREKQKNFYRYPDMTDDYVYLGGNQELVRYADPHVVNNYDRRLADFNANILRVMGRGDDNQISSSASRDGGAASQQGKDNRASHVNLLVDQERQFAAVERDQNIYKSIFNAITEFAGIQEHDVLYVSEVVVDLQALIDEREQARKRAKHPSTLATTAAALLAASEKQREKSEAEEELLESLRMRLQELKNWLEQQARDPSAGRLVLIFENKEDDAMMLEYMSSQQEKDILDVKTLEKQARRVYDDRVTFREPTLPESGAPAKKKKKKKKTAAPAKK